MCDICTRDDMQMEGADQVLNWTVTRRLRAHSVIEMMMMMIWNVQLLTFYSIAFDRYLYDYFSVASENLIFEHFEVLHLKILSLDILIAS